MARRIQPEVPVRLEPGYDHRKSDLVDVIPNWEGEWVQVWDDNHEWVILAYQRTPEGTKDVSRLELLRDGKWSRIGYWRNKRTYWYREPPNPDEMGIDLPDLEYLVHKRVEVDLPDGRMLVTDLPGGLMTEVVWTAEFDWERMNPRGRKLGHRAIEKLKDEKLPVYITTYQCRVDGDKLVRTGLATVETMVVNTVTDLRVFDAMAPG